MALTHALLGQSREADEALDRLDAFARELLQDFGSLRTLLEADRPVLGQVPEIRARIAAEAGGMFAPELVEAFGFDADGKAEGVGRFGVQDFLQPGHLRSNLNILLQPQEDS